MKMARKLLSAGFIFAAVSAFGVDSDATACPMDKKSGKSCAKKCKDHKCPKDCGAHGGCEHGKSCTAKKDAPASADAPVEAAKEEAPKE